MTQPYGLDTSVLVRLATAEPQDISLDHGDIYGGAAPSPDDPCRANRNKDSTLSCYQDSVLAR